MTRKKQRLTINHGMLHDTVDMKATIESQAGTMVGKVDNKTTAKCKNDEIKRKGYVRINQPKK